MLIPKIGGIFFFRLVKKKGKDDLSSEHIFLAINKFSVKPYLVK